MPQQAQEEKIIFSQVLEMIDEGKVKSITVTENTLNGNGVVNVVKGVLKEGDKHFEIYVPSLYVPYFGAELYKASTQNKVTITTVAPQGQPFWAEWLPLIILIAFVAIIWFVMINRGGGANKAMSFGKSRAQLHKQDPKKRVSFDDVAGLKEEKEEMSEVVDFLKNPKKYAKLGARIPKGILMVGLPGTGKTYLSKAIAGEAGVPFYSISGSDFVEMFVGVGASRVRDLFAKAKKDSPCIVFIDEIDAVGRRRGAGVGGGNDEREQTLNQLLVEMDGFGDHEGIIIIAATNRPDILDPALLRPGRFDRRVQIGVPDIKEREQILKVHSRNKPMAADVDYAVLARRTPYFTPADLENLLNEAALMTARNGEKEIAMSTIEEATTKIIAGVEKRSKLVTEREKRLVSVHEAGHAVIAHLLPGTDPVHQVTIIPRGRAGGFTMQLPEEERNYMTKSQIFNELVVLLGGRIAEKVILGDISTGASNDLERVSDLAKDMVVKYAMSDNLSQMAYAEDDDNVFLGKEMAVRKQHSENVMAEIDREIHSLVDRAYEQGIQIIENNKEKLESVAKALYEYENINKEEFELAINEGFEALRLQRQQLEQETQKAEHSVETPELSE